MEGYTVILLYPDYLNDDGLATYTSYQSVKEIPDAIREAKHEAINAQLADGIKFNSIDDFAVLIVFAGECVPVAWGWQTGVDTTISDDK